MLRRRPRRCRCLRTGWRYTCSAAATKLFDFNDISFPSHYLPSRTVVLAIAFYCLGHSKNVYDDDDDDETVTQARKLLPLASDLERWWDFLYGPNVATDLRVDEDWRVFDPGLCIKHNHPSPVIFYVHKFDYISILLCCTNFSSIFRLHNMHRVKDVA